MQEPILTCRYDTPHNDDWYISKCYTYGQDDQGRTAAHKALEKNGNNNNGKEVLDMILDKHPNCGKVIDHKGKLPTDR